MAVLTFHGAAQQVTGSCYLLESPALGRVLLDCGLHQGGDLVGRLGESGLPFEAASIDALILSHAHLDHCGMIPMLVHGGFRGPIHCTRATAKLLPVMLHDSANLYERDLEYQNLRRRRRGESPLPAAYSKRDVEKAIKLCKGHCYAESVSLGEGASVRFHDAGHILGSAIVELRLREAGQWRTLVFSGDLGKRDAALMKNPAVLHKADLVLMEGTYGDRDHRSEADTLEQLDTVLEETWAKKGNVLIPAFAVGRTQEVLFHLACLEQQGKLDHWQIFLDSPMAIEITRIYQESMHLLDAEDLKKLGTGYAEAMEVILPRLRFSETPEESRAINKVGHGAIIIAGSGMCNGGRIRHHIKQRIWNERNTMIFVGFQARGTLGRALVDGARRIHLFREEFIVRARIETLGGLSAHAGQSELIDWVRQFRNQPRILLVHGEAEALDALSMKLWREHQISSEIPFLGQKVHF